MKGRGDVDDALARTGAARGQRCALPTAVTFAHITTARYHSESKTGKTGLKRPGWVRFTSATMPEGGSDFSRR